MTVRELIERLSTYPQDAEVLEERESELRIVHPRDIYSTSPDDGNLPLDEPEDVAEALSGRPCVVFRAWG